MAQLVFRYSTMGAGKSIEVLKIAYNYEEGGKRCLLLTSSLDNRYGEGYIASRIGIKKSAIAFSNKDDLVTIFMVKQITGDLPISCILIDECQFMTEEHVKQLCKIVDYYEIPVICYGLKNDAFNHLFSGSEALLRYADKIEEVKTICQLCERKGTMVLRLDCNGKPMYSGEQIAVGGNNMYVPVCRKCYNNPDLLKLRRI